MKNWIVKNKLYCMGALVGAFSGFMYWKYVGCLTGTCAITSSPINSTLYFAFFGEIVFSIFQKKTKETETDKK